MAPSCASRDARYTLASPKPSKANLQRLPRASPNLARHCTEAGLIEKAAGMWGKAGQRSLARSALVEAMEQLTRALAQIAILPATPTLRREQIKLQVALIVPLSHVKGYAAPETRSAAEQARLLIEQAEAHGEHTEDPLLLFSVLHGVWIANLVAFNGDVMRDLAAQFLALAEKQGTTAPLLTAHRVTGITLLHTGDIAESRKHFDRANALYDPVEHRQLTQLTTSFSIDARVSILSYRSWALWLLGYPEVALADVDHALRDAREIGKAATLMFALGNNTFSSSAGTTRKQARNQTNSWLLAGQKAPCSGRREGS
jgi:predicted ATPase